MRPILPLPVLLALALLGTATVLPAQSVVDASARVGPQFMTYDIKSPIGQKISEYALPVYVLIPATGSLSFDVGAAWARVTVASANGNGSPETSELSGLTDTQIRANYSIGTDFIVLTAGLNLPTGTSTVLPDQLAAATRIASDFLLFPITGFGTGAGGTGGVALARHLGDWNVGVGAAVRHSVAYDPFEDTTGAKLHFQPGDEYRARVGVDRPYGTGRISFGLTYSRFGNDRAGESVYNTGDRYVAQASVTNSVSNADIVVAGWDLFRAAGALANQTRTGRENIADVGVAVGFHTASGWSIEPSLEGRIWTQAAASISASYMGTAGVRLNYNAGGYAITPFVGYTAGSVGGVTATSPASAIAAASSMTGLRAMLTIQFGGF